MASRSELQVCFLNLLMKLFKENENDVIFSQLIKTSSNSRFSNPVINTIFGFCTICLYSQHIKCTGNFSLLLSVISLCNQSLQSCYYITENGRNSTYQH